MRLLVTGKSLEIGYFQGLTTKVLDVVMYAACQCGRFSRGGIAETHLNAADKPARVQPGRRPQACTSRRDEEPYSAAGNSVTAQPNALSRRVSDVAKRTSLPSLMPTHTGSSPITPARSLNTFTSFPFGLEWTG